jgi:hypothetical protein
MKNQSLITKHKNLAKAEKVLFNYPRAEARGNSIIIPAE